MKRTTLKLLLAFCALICPTAAFSQEGNFQTILLSGGGIPIPGVKVAVCSTGLTTTAASVTNNIATLTMSSNPITAGFLATKTLTVSGFTGGDTYYNGTFTIAAVGATTISYALTHANAAAGTNGKAFQTGDATTACAPLSSLFTDDTGTVAAANPTTSDSIGNVSVWALPASYNVQYYGSNITLKVVEMSIGIPGSVPTTLTSLTVTTLTVTGTSSLATATVKSVNGDVQFCDQFTGADASAKIQACINALPSIGGVANALNLTDSGGTGSTTIDPGTKAVTLLLGPTIYNLSQVVLRRAFHIIGMGGYPGNATIIQATGGNAVPAFVIDQGVQATQGVILRGFALTATAGNTTQVAINAIAQNGLGIWYSEFDDLLITGFGGIGINLDGQINNSANQFDTFKRVIVLRKLNGNYALQIIGFANSLKFENCEFDGQLNTQDGLTNIHVAQGTNSVFVPYNIKFDLVTTQFAGVAFLIDGADSLSIDQGHFENIQQLVSVGTGAGFGSLNITMHDSGCFNNCGIGTIAPGVGVGNGFIIKNRGATANVSIAAINNHIFNTPDAFLSGNTGAIVSFGNTIGPEGSYVYQQVQTGAPNGVAFFGQTFATLGTPGNGIQTYCTDCTIANPCAGAGTGAMAKRLNGVWVCN